MRYSAEPWVPLLENKNWTQIPLTHINNNLNLFIIIIIIIIIMFRKD